MTIVGVDPGADRLGICVVSDEGKQVSSRIVSNRPKGWKAIAKVVNDTNAAVAIEGTYGWGLAPALFLNTAGIQVIDVPGWQTAQMRDAGPTRRKTDEIDAFWTARAAQLWGLEPVPVSIDKAEFSSVVSHRNALVREQTARANRVQNLLGRFDPAYRDQLGRLRSKTQWTRLATYDHPNYLLMACTIRELADTGLTEWHHLKLLTATIEALLPDVGHKLCDLPGIGPLGAATIICRVGDIGRFRSEAAFASFIGLAPSEHSSGNSTRHYAGRSGDRQLAGVFDTAIKTQIRTKGPAYYYVQRRVEEGTPRKIAMIAAARKLVRKTWKTYKT